VPIAGPAYEPRGGAALSVDRPGFQFEKFTLTQRAHDGSVYVYGGWCARLQIFDLCEDGSQGPSLRYEGVARSFCIKAGAND
jgi:hypothetical protein